MEKEQAKRLVEQTFAEGFEKANFISFIRNLLKHFDDGEDRRFQYAGNLIKKAFKERINNYERLGTFTDTEARKIDVLVIHLTKDTTLERGRTFLRNFAADYLSNGRGNDKDAILAAYISPSEKDWRFSYIKLEYTRERDESGKVKDRKDITPAKRYSFLVGANERSHTAQTQFLPILQKTSDPTLSEIEEAFKIETVTKEFFARYKDLFENVRQELNAIIEQNDKVRLEFESKSINVDDFAKKLLGQIVFLYFLQKKGWFGVARDKNWGDGDKKFLRNLFGNKKTSQNFFNDLLEPLFYEVLAKERDFDYYQPFDCKIPFLNGGLFEPLYDYDWVHKDILLPDEIFSNQIPTKDGDAGTGILDVFDRYNFTVNEAEPLETEVAVDPEMLGKVFENLLPENERHGKGTYYTPRVIVAYMCQQSLINYLATNLCRNTHEVSVLKPTSELCKNTHEVSVQKPTSESALTSVRASAKEITRADLKEYILRGSMLADFQVDGTAKNEGKHLPQSINDNAERIDKLLADVKICDPAIGSGAFPVGLLQEIVKARETLIKIGKVSFQTTYEIKRHAIENSIYGVDLDSGAIEIAKLRLWLSLVVDEEDRTKIKALPNLDYKIMQGNSLLEEFRGLRLINDKLLEKPSENAAEKVAELKRKIGERSNEFFALYQKGTSELIKRNAVEKEVESLKKQLDDLTKRKDEVSNASLLQGAATNATSNRLNELEELYERFQDETRREQKNVIRQAINNLEHQIISENLDEIEAKLSAAIAKDEILLAEEIAHVKAALKGEIETTKIRKFNKSLEANRNELKNINETRAELNQMDFAKAKPFFLWKLNFSKLFRDKEGFDIVIANPPYVRHEEIKHLKPALERSFSTFTGTADLFVYFYEQGFRLLRENGVLTFITSNKYFRAGYGEKLRGLLSQKAKIEQIIDFGDASVFDATAYASIILLNQTLPNGNETKVWTLTQDESFDDFEAKFHTESFALSQHELTADGWRLESPEVLRLLEKLRSKGTPLGEYVEGRFYRGIVTGLNEAFVVNRETRDRLIVEDAKSAEILKPFLRGRDVKRWQVNYADLWLIYVPWHFPLHNDKTIKGASEKAEKEFEKQYTAIYNHLLSFKNGLSSRNKDETGVRYEWYALQRWGADYWKEFDQPKIVWGNLATKPQFVFTEETYFVSAPACFLVSSSLYLLAILNSTVSRYVVSKYAAERQGGFLEFKPMYVEQISIPTASDEQQDLVGKIVDYILYLKPQINEDEPREKLMISYFEQIIDALCYELYLTEEIHQAGKEFFRPLLAERLPAINEIKADKLTEIRRIFDRLFHRDHIIRQNIFFLDTIESVRIIEGKM